MQFKCINLITLVALCFVSSSSCLNKVKHYTTNSSVSSSVSSVLQEDVDSIFEYAAHVPTYGSSAHQLSSSLRYQFPQIPAPEPFSTIRSSNSNSVLFKSETSTSSGPIVWTKDGGLRGFKMSTILGKNILGFQSIPFAQPPIGKLRFQAPVKGSRWSGIRDAIVPSPTCLQADFIKQYAIVGSEDCLYLNVYTPKIPKFREALGIPVMVFIHGGAFFFGSSNLYGPSYLLDEEVILVSMNYRLGPFGFLTTGDEIIPGNNGLKDQTMAMKWIKENIQAFGGDSSKITIFGESAGAGSVHLHMLSPLSRDYFHAGISQSGSALCSWSISENAIEIGKTYARFFNCTTSNSKLMVDCLSEVDGHSLVKGQLAFLKWSIYPVVVFSPVVEHKHKGAFLDDTPENIYKKGHFANVPWISGYNSNEGGLNIATILLNPTDTKNINTDWDHVGPIILELEQQNNSIQLSRAIRDYYLGDRQISFENRIDSSNMFADRYLYMCGMKSILQHAQMSVQPVYAYHFNYVNSLSIVQLIGQNAKDWGASHLDELIYLLNNTEYYSDLKSTDLEYQVSRIMTNLWTNFAKTGRPFLTLQIIGTKPDVWRPVDSYNSKLQFLDINLQPKMIQNPFNDRMKFWNGLDLDDT